ncbi:hypothetical protein GCK72_019280 [Caenorhabditis remanei]|uniref:Uncharacterized protein n=1 Tax=Caenorhabditis remanei TaxID=31234 RepID=A0A6A5GDJ0_CAERE|nr:hypothetical protein GCK72_019280 [Caenorhabditis remanei]KAF1752725.1 hypothetical protein GCK72_019280 [Caenorhabditis remanei]
MFSIFDILYSISEILTPLGVQGNKHGFVVFISEGLFFNHPEIGQRAMSIRCGFVSISYALLIIHFVYRYLALFFPQKLHLFFKPIGITLLTTFLLLHGSSWTLICQNCIGADEEIRKIVSKCFIKEYGVGTDGVPMLAALYWGVRPGIQFRSWLGITLLTIISWYSMSVYFILGYKITMKIKSITFEQTLSSTSIRLQRQLFLTLVVQTCIPIIASFLPTVISWYAPIFDINIGWWNTNVSTVALAAFPCIDPLAIIILVPNYRNALLRRNGVISEGHTSGNIVPPNSNVMFERRVR